MGREGGSLLLTGPCWRWDPKISGLERMEEYQWCSSLLMCQERINNFHINNVHMNNFPCPCFPIGSVLNHLPIYSLMASMLDTCLYLGERFWQDCHCTFREVWILVCTYTQSPICSLEQKMSWSPELPVLTHSFVS